MDVTPPPRQEPHTPQQRRTSAGLHWPHLAAITVGVALALLVSSGGGAAAVWGKTLGMFSPKKTTHNSIPLSDRDLDRQRPQRQAEILLERAVSRTDGAAGQAEAQLETRPGGLRGKLKWRSPPHD